MLRKRWGDRARSPLSRAGLALVVAFLVGACAQTAPATNLLPAGSGATALPREPIVPQPLEAPAPTMAARNSDDPRDLAASLGYARTLKAAGEPEKALSILQQASIYHGESRELASDYGRLALELGQIRLAGKLLDMADDPGRPDWGVISARGTVLAHLGQYRGAIACYERALALAPGQASVTSNLGLALAADGQWDKAEPLLRRAAEARGSDPRVRQNLALVLGLRGNYEEARQIAALDLPAGNASADIDSLRQLAERRGEPLEGGPAPAVLGWSARTFRASQP